MCYTRHIWYMLRCCVYSIQASIPYSTYSTYSKEPGESGCSAACLVRYSTYSTYSKEPGESGCSVACLVRYSTYSTYSKEPGVRRVGAPYAPHFAWFLHGFCMNIETCHFDMLVFARFCTVFACGTACFFHTWNSLHVFLHDTNSFFCMTRGTACTFFRTVFA